MVSHQGGNGFYNRAGKAIMKNKISDGIEVAAAALVVVSGLNGHSISINSQRSKTYGSPLWSEYDGQVSFEPPCGSLKLGLGRAEQQR